MNQISYFFEVYRFSEVLVYKFINDVYSMIISIISRVSYAGQWFSMMIYTDEFRRFPIA